MGEKGVISLSKKIMILLLKILGLRERLEIK
jgi:hypothetical protein